MFPRLIGRGPIEAVQVRISKVMLLMFPRLIGRGPIEADEVLDKHTDIN